jgi:hypothetical protein
MDKIIIDIGCANLVVQKYDSDHPVSEIIITLDDKKTGLVIQDIATIRQALDEARGKITPDTIECLVWADSCSEDYTNKFTIDCCNDEIVE